MNTDAVVGCVILILALGLMSYLVWWSCRTIAMISKKNVDSVRDILQELKHERKA